MPQREFARKIGLAQSTIMRIENLEQNVTLKTLEQLCKTYRIDVADLFPAITSAEPHKLNTGMRTYPDGTPRAAVLHEQKPDGKPPKK